jgi:diguanylate cyclase (GGDEF)-like protein
MTHAGTVASQLRLQRRRLGRGVAVGLVLLAVGLSVMVVRVDPAVGRTEQASRLVAQMFEGMLDEESGVRGYLLTSDETFLSRYNNGLQLVAEARAQLPAVVASHGLRLRLAVTLDAVDDWQNRYAVPAVSTVTIALTAQVGDQLFDTFRLAEGQLSDGVQSAASAAASQQRLCLLGGFAFVVLAAIGLLTTVAYQGRRLDRWIGKPIADLDAAVGAMRGTQMSSRPMVAPTGDGPAEVQRVWSTLSALNVDLAIECDARKDRDAQLATSARRAAELLELTQDFAGSLDAADIRDHLELSAGRLTNGTAKLIDVDASTHQPRRAVKASGAVAEAAVRRSPVFRNGTGAHVLAVPLIIVDQECSAVLQVHLSTDDIDPELVTAVSTLCSHAATALTAARLHQQIAESSRLDALTGLPNRQTFDTDIDEAAGRPFDAEGISLLMVDVDHFKRINDTFGHQTGDDVLRLVAAALAQAARPGDTVYRYGGEEFAVLLPGTHMLGAAACARRLRAHVAQQLLAHNVTVSIGVADLHAQETAHTLIARTDQALYQAKTGGRNRVATA